MLQVWHAKWNNRLQKVRAQKAVVSSQSSGSSFIPRRSKVQLKIEMLKESLRQREEEMRRWGEAMWKRDEFYAHAFSQQRAMLHISSLNYFIRYRALSSTFKTNSLYCIMYSKWHSNMYSKCRSSNLPHHYLTLDRHLELRYVSHHLSLLAPSF
jgi:hypothetical protein